jgi:pyruvate dehydrogenase E2 component (dihydrolipoamide acetyltransferase)
MESVLISKWLVRVGDCVTTNQPILEVETQKATSEVYAPESGYVRRICVEEGQTVSEKSLLCILTNSADEPLQNVGGTRTGLKADVQPRAHKRPGNGSESSGSVKASPAARRVSRELNIDISIVSGSGPGGRVTEEDVRRAAGASSDALVESREDAWQLIPATRAALVAQMQRSLREIPQLHLQRLMDVTPLMVQSNQITFTHRLTHATAKSLVHHPALRTVFDENRTRLRPVSVAIAMDTAHGLVAPAVRNADTLSLEQLAAAIADLRRRAETNQLRRSELIDAPFAISNLGMFGVDQFNAFVFHGQTAVLSVGRAKETDQGQRFAWIGIAADHRVVDGSEAARFLQTLQTEILRR